MANVQDDDRKCLRNFFGAYFHEDWYLEAEDFSGVVELYMRSAKQAEIDQLKDAIQRLIDSDEDDASLEARITHDYGPNFVAGGVGLTVRGWLQSIVELLSSKV